MTWVGTVVPRAIGVIALLILAVVALRGYIPGGGGPHAASTPSVVSVALMPVLSLVSIVILLAGVMTSQHRLPLALPDIRPRLDRRSLRLGRIGLVLVIALAAIAFVAAAGWVVHLLASGHVATVRQSPVTSPSKSAPSSVPAPRPTHGQPELSGRAMLLVGITAGVLVAVALASLVVVAIGTRRRPVPGIEPASAASESLVSLAQVAEMGLAASRICPGWARRSSPDPSPTHWVCTSPGCSSRRIYCPRT
jgi:hypothetical protein